MWLGKKTNPFYIWEMQKIAYKIIRAYFSTSKILYYQFVMSHKEHDFQVFHDLNMF